MAIKPSGLLHPHHVAELLACTERHVRNLINQGKLEAVRIGKRRRRITRESVMAFLDKNRVDSKTFFE